MDATEKIVVDARRPLMRWSAIFAGLVLVIAAYSLLLLLGSALGLSIADATDAAAVGEGFGIGAGLWMLLSSIIAFFFGGMLAARLDGNPEHGIGALHGITLWSAATVLLAYLATAGILGTAQLAGGAVQSAASAVAGGDAVVGAMGGGMENSAVGNRIAAMVKTQIAEQLSRAQGPEQQAASPQEIRQAVEGLDPNALTDVGMALVRGDVEGAKSVLAINTSLSRAQIDAVVNGVSTETNQAVNAAKAKMAQTSEQVAKYGEAVLWSVFISSALGLIAAVVGGWAGPRTFVRQPYATAIP